MDTHDITFSWQRPKTRDRATYLAAFDRDGKPVLREQSAAWLYEWAEERFVGEGKRHHGKRLAAPPMMNEEDGRPVMAPETPHEDYAPLEENSALFLELARLEISEEAIVGFASKYGLLEKIQIAEQRAFGLGDLFDDWKECITRLRMCVDIWNASRAGEKIPHLRNKAMPHRKSGSLGVEAELDDLSVFHVLPIVEKEQVPRFFILAEVTSQLQGAASIVFAPRNGVAFRTSIQPGSLKQAIWLQFALALSNEKNYRDCSACGRPFEVSLSAFRTNRTLCSEACKFRGYRQRKATAVQLRKEGKTLQYIAKAVGSTVPTVKGWLAKEGK